MTSRRKFLKIGAMTGAGLLVPWKFGVQTAFAQGNGTPLAGSSIPQFIDPLPLLSVDGGPIETIIADTSSIELTMREFKANVMPSSFVPASGGPYGGTWVWGYRAGVTPYDPAGTYTGPVIVAARGTPTRIKYVNNLTANHIAWRDWTDQTMHWADPLHNEGNFCAMNSGGPATGYCAEHYQGPIPATPHLHGGEVPPVVDGGPDAWFTGDGNYHGHDFYSMDSSESNYAIYRYLNTQEPGPLWFHDHALGITRLNVYSGLAGAYVLTDPSLSLPTGLHPVGLQQGASGDVDYLIPLVLQDRMFDTNGQLYFPTAGINPEHPFWVPEFVGDTIVVNGKVWPYLEVEPRRYRFLLINGSNARTYELFIVNPATKAMGPPIWQIETDGGYLDAPVKIDPRAKTLNKLRVMSGERAGFIIDFSDFAGQTLLIRNNGRTPYPKGESPHGSTVGQILQIRVAQNSSYTPDQSYDPASGVPLRPSMIRLVNPSAGTKATGVSIDKTRQLTLNEVIGAGGPLEVLVNNARWDGLQQPGGNIRTDYTPVTIGGITEYLSEVPNEGETELWEIVNLTADAHPIHLHLVQFQLMNRQNFNMNKYGLAYNAAFPGGAFVPAYGPPLNYATGNSRALGGNPDITRYLQGRAIPPDANEAGWKDTVMAPPGMVTRFIVRYVPTDKAIDSNELYYPFNPNAGGQGYVWHCHIVDHEDNEMMRPVKVVEASSVSRDYFLGTDY